MFYGMGLISLTSTPNIIFEFNKNGIDFYFGTYISFSLIIADDE